MKKTPSKLAAEFYNKIINLHHQEFNYKGLQYKDWLDLLILKLEKGSKILDLGCGNGRTVKYFVDKGFQVIGIDLSDNMLKLAKKYVPKGEFYKKDFTKLNFKSNSFNAIISFFALNHIPKKQFKNIIKRCKRLLRPNGFLLLGMVKGQGEGLFEGFYGKKLQLYGAGYTKKEIIQILRLNGFNILKTGIEHFKGKYFEEDDIYLLARINK